eukprot:9537608-Karenia_brevis.AAC.1
MLEAANFTKKEMLLCESSVFTRSQTLLTISRAYWDQNLKVATLLWARSALARHHLGSRHVDGKQLLFLRFPEMFAQLLDDVKLGTLEKEMKEEQKRTQQKGRSRLSSKAIALMRKSRLWVKTDRRLILNGIVQTLGSGERVVLRDDQAAQAL